MAPLKKPTADEQPSTRFGKLTILEDGACVSNVNWTQVVLYEPERVAEWLLYLHRHELKIIDDFIKVVDDSLPTPEDLEDEKVLNSPQWKAYIETQLSCVVMDILLEPGMFSEDPSTFKVCRSKHCT